MSSSAPEGLLRISYVFRENMANKLKMEKNANSSDCVVRVQIGTSSSGGTTRNISQASGEGTVNERTARHWFQRMHNGDESLQDEEVIVDDQLKAIVEAEPHKTTREIAEELDVDQLKVVRHLHQIGKSKSSTDRCRTRCGTLKDHIKAYGDYTKELVIDNTMSEEQLVQNCVRNKHLIDGAQ
uniref:HTH_48 domain-containing protein n=1 Tax=Heterorhabditis bacteriophora TaxID=37862 RepID=A0A1I7WXW4_HETBA